MYLTILRHGETDWNATGRIQGQQDVVLNQRGIQQAQAAAAYLKAQQVDALYSSDLRRALESAQPLSQQWQLKIRPLPELREWKLGILEGLLRTEAAQQYPQVYPVYDEQQADGLIPGGETIRQRYQRAINCIEQLSKHHPNEHVLIVTHGGILDNWYRYVHQIPLEQARDWVLHNAGISQFQKIGQQWQTLSWSQTEHLQEIGAMAYW
ncbi:histidine phosphatase family protein [Candidatus Venteria ishoeyi]|uniref:histidine phosphatase family protein n=1 Tax=Candidatus Venteria ishoeyi TaxID=1899563 RepID=UPI0025A50D9C|nr:histidine phosphatase family protein [Candidatus Venteria ishoeyi]MDM8547184.1 histidine phosphatase family protein [Candidatus Venteria ishoeyi]